jgi:hypothetical protein
MSLIVPTIADTVHYWGTLRILVKSISVPEEVNQELGRKGGVRRWCFA